MTGAGSGTAPDRTRPDRLGAGLRVAVIGGGIAGLTAAWWQVLGAVLAEPLTVAGIARDMGITRQSVQRIADILAERGLARYLPNPAHRRAKLLTPTGEGRAAIARIGPGHAAAAGRLAKAMGEQPLADAVAALQALSAALS